MQDNTQQGDAGFDVPNPGITDDPTLPVTLEENLVPIDRDGVYVPNHLDERGTLHFFAAVDVSDQPDFDEPAAQIRYFRVAQPDDGQLVHDSHPVMPLKNSGDSPFPLPALQIMLEDGDLDNVQALAYLTAQSHGLDFPDPAALPELSVPPYGIDTVSVNDEPFLDEDSPSQMPLSEPRVEQFREKLAHSQYRLLEPVDPTVNYSFEVVAADPWTLELSADKWWIGEDGRIGSQAQTLQTYSLEWYEWEREAEREIAAMDREDLYRTYQDSGLEAAMHQAEALAVTNDELDPDRVDGRLFQQGPPDRFTTLREAELTGLNAAPEPDDWEALIAAQTDDTPEPERHYWQMHHHPVETPAGERLGTALFVTEFPQLPPDFDGSLDANGNYPTAARTLEMAHFANDDDARRFEAEFRGYLVPDLLDGPELAPEVAKLEGLSGEWEDMDYRGIVDYMSGNHIVVREESDWHPHNPNAEREAQGYTEGVSPLTDDTLAYVDDDQSAPAYDPAAPDIDL